MEFNGNQLVPALESLVPQAIDQTAGDDFFLKKVTECQLSDHRSDDLLRETIAPVLLSIGSRIQHQKMRTLA